MYGIAALQQINLCRSRIMPRHLIEPARNIEPSYTLNNLLHAYGRIVPKRQLRGLGITDHRQRKHESAWPGRRWIGRAVDEFGVGAGCPDLMPRFRVGGSTLRF
jgi:hypothetical protein